MSTYMAPKRKSAKSNSEPSSNGSSPPASVNLTNGNNMNQVANNNNLNATNNNNNAPKYGTLVPNRVFVGGISSTTTETELCQLFSKYGNVKATKIIADRAGVSKGYGFVTFETDEEAKRLQLDADNIVLKERRLNIAPAIIKQGPQVRYERKNRKNKKIIISIEETIERNENNQAFPPRGFEAASPPPMIQSVYYHNGIPYTFQNGTAFFQPPQLQAAPLPAAPDAAMYPGAGYGPAQGPSQPQAQLMYPYANPAPMFLPQYHQYAPVQMNQQQPHQQLMYSTPIQTATNGTDTPPPMSMSPHANASYYVQGDMRPDMYYMPPSTGQPYPYPTPMLLTSVGPEPSIQYCEIATDQQGSNAPNEVFSPQPIAEELAIVPTLENTIVPSQEQSDAPPNSDAANEEHKTLVNTETPIVSAKNLQKIDESENNNRDVRYRGNRQGGHGRYSDVQNNAPQGDYNERGAWKRNRGGRTNMNNIPKFPFNNNNTSATNNNNYNKGEGGNVNRGGYRGGHGNGGGRGSYRMNQQNGAGGRRIVNRSSTPPTESYSFPPPNKPLHSNQFQISQQAQTYMAGRSMQVPYHPANAAHHAVVAAASSGSAAQQHYNAPPPPPPPPAPHHQANVPPRRYNTIASNQRRNYQNNNHHSSRKRVETIDNGAAGDAPLHNHETVPSASKASPPPTATNTDQDIISGVKNLSVQ